MKKHLPSAMIIILMVFTVLLSSCTLHQPDTSDLVFFDGHNERVTDVSTYSELKVASIVTDKGNCYINGNWFDDEKCFGVDNIIQFNNWFQNSADPTRDDYIQIYNGGDAEKVRVSSAGGIIFTKKGTVFLFVNGNKQYRTPTQFSTDLYIDGYLDDDNTVYLLQKNGDFGYYHLSSPNKFNVIARNINKFKFQHIIQLSTGNEYKKIYLLNKKHQLYIVDKDQYMIDESKCISDVVDFDVSDNTRVAYLTSDGTMYYSEQYNPDVSIEYLLDKAVKQNLHQNDLKEFALYDGGIIYLYENENVYVVGYELGFGRSSGTYHNEMIGSDYQKVAADKDSICLINNDGILTRYGALPNGADNYLFF